MKTHIKRIATLCLLTMLAIVLNSFNAIAQEDHHKGDRQGNRHEKMEAQKIAFLTKELELTPDEAKVFWPVYNEYDAKRMEMRKSFRNDKMDKDEFAKLTEKEAVQLLDNQIIEAQKLLDLRKEYHAKFKAVLPAVKVLKLYDTEREFQKMLIDRIKQNRPSPPLHN